MARHEPTVAVAGPKSTVRATQLAVHRRRSFRSCDPSIRLEVITTEL